ncbi:MAG: hypothetical protein GX112_06455 [Clostridiaceae bacterium]|jgi:membrane AbrB-like protein|nr:hypothetical protein [Clostridiaceae bacterium]
MTDLARLALTLLVASLGGYLGYKAKIPAGTMLGALLFTVLLNLIVGQAFVPAGVRPWLQMCSGALLGAGIRRRDVRELKYLILPGLVMIVLMMVMNVLFGYLMYRFSHLDLATALLAAAPGGMTDMALIAGDLGGDPMPVTLLHLARLLIIYALLPFIFARLQKYQNAHPVAGRCRPPEEQVTVQKKKPGPTDVVAGRRQAAVALLMTLGAAAAGGSLLWQLGVNAGAMIGAMLAVAALNLTTGKALRPVKLRTAVQVLAGAFIGQNMTRANIGQMAGLIAPLLIMVVSVVVFIVVISLSLIALSRLDRATCILMSAPGGLQEVSLMALDLQADAPKVMVMQTTRLMVVIALFPSLLTAAAGLLGD